MTQVSQLEAIINTLSVRLGVHAPSPLQPLSLPAQLDVNSNKALDKSEHIQLWCKRDDLLHPVISGNKWRKLLLPLAQLLLEKKKPRVLSFGGAYSNHLHALAFCCAKLNIEFTAVVRGKYLANNTLNPTLSDIRSWGGELHFVSKDDYARRNEHDYINYLKKQLMIDSHIPEGGSQYDALYGLNALMEEIHSQASSFNKPLHFDQILFPVATGATLAGLVASNHQSNNTNIVKSVKGVAVLKGDGYLENLVERFLPQKSDSYLPWSICHDYHFGGYAKTTNELNEFCKAIASLQKEAPLHSDTNEEHLAIEPCYSGKLFFAVNDMIAKGLIPKGSQLLLLHTGGLQGARKL